MLADRAEHKVAKHRSRANPTFDQRHDLELMHIRPNSQHRTLPKVFGLYEGGRDNALSNKPIVSRYAQKSDVATCQTPASSLVIPRNQGCVSTRDSKKGLRRVLIGKESLERVPVARLRLCLRCAISWTGVARWSSVKERNLGEKLSCKKVGLKKPCTIQDE